MNTSFFSNSSTSFTVTHPGWCDGIAAGRATGRSMCCGPAPRSGYGRQDRGRGAVCHRARCDESDRPGARIQDHQIHRPPEVPLQGSAERSSGPIKESRRLCGVQHPDIDVAVAVLLTACQAAIEIGADEVSARVVESRTELLHNGVIHSMGGASSRSPERTPTGVRRYWYVFPSATWSRRCSDPYAWQYSTHILAV